MNQINPLFVQAALAIALALLGLITQMLNLRMKAGAGKDVALELVTQAKVVVNDINQRIKPQVTGDGTITASAAKDLKTVAVAALKDQMSQAALTIIKSNSEKVEDVLGRAIESAVADAKAVSPIVPAT